MIETRPYVDGFFKGLIYCNSLSEAENISDTLNNGFLLDLNQNYKATIKRGCSEYPIAYPKFTVPTKLEPVMVYDENWLKIEKEFDAKTLKAKENQEFETVSGLSLNDFIILKNWGKYALGLGDQSFDGNYFDGEEENYFYTQGVARKQLYKQASY